LRNVVVVPNPSKVIARLYAAPPTRSPPVYFEGQLHMGVYWFRLGRITVWVKRAVIPDVT
jgi:hypothetical protein